MRPDINELIRLSRLRVRARQNKLPEDFYINQELANAATEIAKQSINKTVVLSFPKQLSSTTQAQLQLINPTSEASEDSQLIKSDIVLNKNQQKAVDLALSGQSFVLIGPAGTGKTFTVKHILEALIRNHKLPMMTEETKTLAKGDYGFIATSSTRRATNVVRKGLPAGLKAATGHALIEYQPEFYAAIDEATGNLVNKMRFIATRHQDNPLPSCLALIAYDEASMLSVDFHKEIQSALPHRPQEIYIGDLCQLKPVFGDAILGYKLNELPVVELTEVYRQKDGEILDFITDVREGKVVTDFNLPRYNNERLTIKQFTKPERREVRTAQLGNQLQIMIDSNQLDPLTGDFILCPFNVGLGTTELNNFVADYYDQKLNRKIIEVVSGMTKRFFAIGDKILVDRNDAVITDIQMNPAYIGRQGIAPSYKLNRWGGFRATKYGEALTKEAESLAELEADSEIENYFEAQGHLMSMEESLESLANDADKIKLTASHIISYTFLDPTEQQLESYTKGKQSHVETAVSAGDVNKIELAYCISIHKSQGSQARHVVLLLANQHAQMFHRELLYTAASRAQEKLTIICDSGNINKCISNARIKGETISEKAEFFKGRSRDKETQ